MHYISFDPSAACVLESAGRFISVNHPFHPRRRLSSAVLLLGYSGTYPIAQDGREYLLEPGTFLFLFPEHEHYGYAPAGNGQSHFWCHIQIPTNHAVFSSEFLPDEDTCLIPEFGHLAHPERFFILFNQLIDAANRSTSTPALRQNICNAYASILLNSLSEESWNTRRAQFSAQSQNRTVLAEKVQQWIRLHYQEPINAQTVAQAIQYNSDYLTQVMKSSTGLTLSETITQIRLQEAEKLLLNSDMRIAEIAYAVGFRDEKYFMKAFKKAESVTPSNYRQAHFRMHMNRK